jgi:uncharacterized protein (TIGR02118 family)
MIKATLLYGHPADSDAFEKYYAEIHLPIASKMKGVEKLELTKFLSAPDGSKAAYYRMAELYFPSPAGLQETMASVEGQAAVADLANFATGGVTMIVGSVEN